MATLTWMGGHADERLIFPALCELSEKAWQVGVGAVERHVREREPANRIEFALIVLE